MVLMNDGQSRKPIGDEPHDIETLHVVNQIRSQWRNPSNILSLLLLIGGDIVQRALAQQTGDTIPTPVVFSFGWVAYTFVGLLSAVGNSALMPLLEFPAVVFSRGPITTPFLPFSFYSYPIHISLYFIHTTPFPHAAAYVTNPAFRVLIANPAATALITPLQRRDPNVLAALFLDPAARDFYVNWDEVSRASVSALRLVEGFTPAHPEVTDLIARLRRDSATFCGLWDDHAVAGLTATRKTIRHPEVGMLTLSYQTFDVRSSPGQQLTVATAAPESPSADALALLGTLEATRSRERL